MDKPKARWRVLFVAIATGLDVVLRKRAMTDDDKRPTRPRIKRPSARAPQGLPHMWCITSGDAVMELCAYCGEPKMESNANGLCEKRR